MKNSGKSIYSIAAVLIISFIILMISVSLLGENDKIDSLIDKYFNSIQEQRYFSIEENQNIVESFNVFDIDGDYSENCLLLELALLEKYHIPETSNYKIEIEKSHFWIPFVSNPNIHINIYLKNAENNHFFTFFKRQESPEATKDLFTVERKNSRWLITAINIQDSFLFESISKLKDSLNIDNYVSFSDTKLTVKPIEIDTRNITSIERRKFNYIFQKLYQLTEIKKSTNKL